MARRKRSDVVNREVVMTHLQGLLGLLILLAGTSAAGLAGEPPEPARTGTDPYGDPLPPGALVRMGTVRWRHGGQVTDVAFVDAKTLASRGEDGAIRLWDVSTGKQVRQLDGGTLGGLAVSADGRLLAGVNNRDWRIELWEAATGRRLRQFGPAKGQVTGLLLSRDGNLLVAAHGGQVCIWGMDEPEQRQHLPAPQTGAALALSKDGKVLASSGRDKEICLWDPATGQVTRRLAGHEEAVYSVAFSPTDEHLLASGGQDRTIRLWDVDTGGEVGRFRQEWVVAVAFAPDGKTLAALGKEQEWGVFLWDVARKKQIRRLALGYPNTLLGGSVAFSPDGRYLASMSGDSTVHVWEVAAGQAFHASEHHQQGIGTLALSPDGKVAASGSSEGTVHLWEVATGKELGRLAGHREGVSLMAFGADGKTLITRDKDHTRMHWWDVAAGTETRCVRGPWMNSNGAALAPDRKTLAVLDANAPKFVHVLEADTGRETHRFETAAEERGRSGLTYSPDGKWLASTRQVWSTATGKVVRQIAADEPNVALAFSPDSRLLAALQQNRISLWEVDQEKPPRQLSFGPWGCTCLAYSPDGKLLAVGGRESVRVWDVTAGKQVHEWAGHRGPVEQVAFTPDGARLVSGGADTTLLVWDVNAAVGSKH
jgi:WD40 repeat protein